MATILFLITLIITFAHVTSEILVDEFSNVNSQCLQISLGLPPSMPFKCLQADSLISNKCLKCDPYFFLNANQCLKKIDNCKYQTQLNICELCADGFAPRYISNSRKFDACLQTVTNCKIYTPYNQCFECLQGFYLKDNVCVSDSTFTKADCYEYDYASVVNYFSNQSKIHSINLYFEWVVSIQIYKRNYQKQHSLKQIHILFKLLKYKCIRPHIYYAFSSTFDLIDNKMTRCRQYDLNKLCIQCHPGYDLSVIGICNWINEGDLPFNWMFASVNELITRCISTYNNMVSLTTVQTLATGKVIYGCFLETFVANYFSDTNCSDNQFRFINQMIVCTACAVSGKVYEFKSSTNLAKCVINGAIQCLSYSQPGKCIVCAAGYYLTASQVCEIVFSCPQGKYYASPTKSCVSYPPQCVAVDLTGVCTLCACGFYLNASSSCVAVDETRCAKEFAYEKLISPSSTLGCYKCKLTFTWSAISGTCEDASIIQATCDAARYQKFLISDGCQGISNCADVVISNAARKCMRCDVGFILSGGTCIASPTCQVFNADYTQCVRCKNATPLVFGGKCYALLPNCEGHALDSSGNLFCMQCYPFFQKTAEGCVQNAPNVAHCLRWDITNNECGECDSFLYTQKPAGICVLVSAFANCSEFYQNICIACSAGFYLNEKQQCVSVQQCGQPSCSKDNCSNLLYGFELGACISSIGLIPYCKTYSQLAKQPLSCIECYPGYQFTVQKDRCLQSLPNCDSLADTSNTFAQQCNACSANSTLQLQKRTCILNASAFVLAANIFILLLINLLL